MPVHTKQKKIYIYIVCGIWNVHKLCLIPNFSKCVCIFVPKCEQNDKLRSAANHTAGKCVSLCSRVHYFETTKKIKCTPSTFAVDN